MLNDVGIAIGPSVTVVGSRVLIRMVVVVSVFVVLPFSIVVVLVTVGAVVISLHFYRAVSWTLPEASLAERTLTVLV